VSPFRALLAAHLQETWNRSAREMGKQAAWVMGLVMLALVFMAALPLLLGMGALGFLLAPKLNQAPIQTILGGLLALLCLLGGVVGGIVGGARQLEWEAYRGFPLRLPALYLAELLAGLGDLLPLVLSVALLGLMGGLGLASPRLLPLALLTFAEVLLAILALQVLVSGLAAALVKRLRLALVMLGLLAWLLAVFAGNPASLSPVPGLQAAQVARVEAAGRVLGKALSLLPTHAMAKSLALAQAGAWGAALRSHLVPLAALALLMLAGARVLLRESEAPKTSAIPKGQARLWSFRTPAMGLARLHFQTIMGSQLGRFAFVMPLVTVVLIKGPFARLGPQGQWGLPVAFAYLSLVGGTLALNQFGLDRHGIKALLLLPIPAEDLLRGKLWGGALHQGLQALLLLLLLGLLGRPNPLQMVAALLLMGCLFLVQYAVGQWTSAWMPRPMLRDSMKSNQLPFAVAMISLFGSALWSGVLVGLYGLLGWLAPAWQVPGMGLLFALVALGHRALLPHAAAYLERRKETLVEALG
jgi:hypothetical protein